MINRLIDWFERIVGVLLLAFVLGVVVGVAYLMLSGILR